MLGGACPRGQTQNNCNSIIKKIYFIYFYFFKILFIFRERGREEGERDRNINVWLPLACPLLGIWPATQACALDWESNK